MPRSMTDALREAFESAPSVQDAQQRAEEPEDNADELGDEEDDESPDAGDSEDDGVEVEFANDLPEVLGIDPEEVYRLKLRLADGEDPIALGDVKDRLQSVETERKGLAEQRAQLERQQQELQQQSLQYGQANQAITQKTEEARAKILAIQGSMPALEVDWANRQQSDPGRVALEKQEIQKRLGEAQVELQSAQAEADHEQQQAYQGWLMEQHRALTAAIPEWGDTAKREAIQKDVASVAVHKYGFRPEELGNFDARMIQMAIDAKAGLDAKNGAKDAVTKVRKAPKVRPSGVRLKNRQHAKQRVQDQIKKAQQTRTRRDIIDATRGVIEEARSKRG